MAIKSPLQIERDEHDEDLFAKKTSLVSASTIYAVVNTSLAGLTTLAPSPNYIGLVSVSGFENPLPVSATNFDIRDLVAATDNVTATPIDDDTASGSLTSGQSQAYLLSSGRSSISWQFSGTWSGTVFFEKSLDNTNWEPMAYVTSEAQGTNDVVTEVTTNGIFFSSVGSTQRVRIRRGAGTGTLTFNAARSVGIKVVALNKAIPTGANIIGAIKSDYELAGNTTHVKKYFTNAGAVTDGIVWSPASGKRWYLTDIFVNVSAAATVTLEDDLAAGDDVVWKAELAANSGWSHAFTTPLFSGEDAADLLITTSAGNVYVMAVGYEV